MLPPWLRPLLQFQSTVPSEIKLTKKNYLLWRAQLLPFLRSTNLIGYLDGSIPAPAKQVASSTTVGADLIPNPEYTTWYNQD
jgi:hypothetical protein